jgi:hypothetical protein
LVQLLWLHLDQERINQVLLLSIDIYESNLIIRKSFSRMSLAVVERGLFLERSAPPHELRGRRDKDFCPPEGSSGVHPTRG